MQFQPSTGDGRLVEVRGELWRIVRKESFDACAVLTLRGSGDANLGITTELLLPFDRVTPIPRRVSFRRASRRTVLARAACAVAGGHGWAQPWIAATAHIDLLPWQLEPAVAALSGTTRLLLADDVGLGKTVQAGLLMAELRVRGLISRALVLTPASLREQWAAELRDRFALRPQIFDQQTIGRLAATLPVGVNPWSAMEIGISSIDLVKRTDVRSALDMVPIDLLIVDEAHHLRPATDRAALVADLAKRATWVVLATATPHSGDPEAYRFIRELGMSGEDPPLRVFRRRAHEIGWPRNRRVRFRPVATTGIERALLDDAAAYAKAIWHAHAGASQAALVASVICRRAVSSPGSLARTLARRRQLLCGDAAHEIPQALQPQLPWLEPELADDVEADSVLSGAALRDPAAEIAALDRLLARAEQLGGASAKFDCIERLLTRTREPAIVFSEYRHTLTDLAQRLENRVPAVLLHGGLSTRERRGAINQFVSGRARVLLATDAAGEGLNLQSRCRLVINVELPWNPVRLEQRIGRVDRLGQTRRVHAVHLYHRESFEDRVLARLHRRMHQAAFDLVDTVVTDRQVAAAVFGHVPVEAAPLERSVVNDTSPCALSDLALCRIARQIAVAASATARPAVALCAPMSGHGRCDAITLLFEIDTHVEDGRLVSRDVLPLVVHFSTRVLAGRRQMKMLTTALVASAAVNEILTRERAASVDRARASVGPAARLIEKRLSAILRMVEQRPSTLVQTSLFDRRTERQSRTSDAARELLQQHVRRHLDAARALQTIMPAHVRLIAAWPLTP